ncbi:hypothetical protein HF675_12075 [Serratia sp. JUb9]|uniref:hypothetical protein n=1 Tax=Serratia sp. JUb9 TaxID=2724469 RepID=UPI00164E8BF5|nr:hypothetical protein [Serratia sp. JUb9]QNK30408.1 hypothetical protein HF675_12075 [Serratia sp. JUb9]
MDVMDAGKAIALGIASIPRDAYLGLERTLQDLNLSDGRSYYQRRNLAEDARFARGMIKIAKNRNQIYDIARIILDDVIDKVPEPVLRWLHSAVTQKQTEAESSWVMQNLIVTYLAQQLCEGVMMSAFFKLTIRTTLTAGVGLILTQGLLANAANASRELALTNPALYRKLYIKDFDMLYFMFEKPIGKITKLIQTYQNSPAQLQESVRNLDFKG